MSQNPSQDYNSQGLPHGLYIADNHCCHIQFVHQVNVPIPRSCKHLFFLQLSQHHEYLLRHNMISLFCEDDYN